MNKIISKSKCLFSLFNSNMYILSHTAINPWSGLRFTPPSVPKAELLTLNPSNTTPQNSPTESQFWPNPSIFLPMFTLASLLMSAAETKPQKLVEPAYRLKIPISRLPSTPVKQSTTVSHRWPEVSSRWNTIVKIVTITHTASLTML